MQIVLDVGCGMGILSMFAAKAGAAKVVAVERSNILEITRKIVKANKLDHIIEIIQGRVSFIQLKSPIPTCILTDNQNIT